MLKTNQVEKIKVWERGQITLPKKFREQLGIVENDILYLYKIGRALYLSKKELTIPEIRKITSRIKL